MEDLFEKNFTTDRPLADRMRPESLNEFFGQEQVIGKGKLLRQAIERDEIPSMIFWGPPGSGKTTLAQVIARMTKSSFVQLSAVSSGLKDFREIIEQAEGKKRYNRERTILFIDEIHRWNKSQQDALLPHVERGVVILIGATTENPSFEVNSALLSRCKVFVLEQLSPQDIKGILERALNDKVRGFGEQKVEIEQTSLDFLSNISNGDARIALNTLEFAVRSAKLKKGKIVLTRDILIDSLQKSHFLYDHAGEQHYNIISALHKSVRGNNPDAALYWLGRMLEAGEDPLYIARRLIRMAVEDIGMANSQALEQAVACYQGCHFVGMPECDVILAQCVVYLAKSKKSVAIYQAYGKVKKDVRETMDEPVPIHLRNAPTKLMKELGYGKDYKYSPAFDWKEDQGYLPDKLKSKRYLDAE